jgi:hypothetical protein
LVAVEAQRSLVVRRPEQHPAGEDFHAVVSITYRRAEAELPGSSSSRSALCIVAGLKLNCPAPPHRAPRSASSPG